MVPPRAHVRYRLRVPDSPIPRLPDAGIDAVIGWFARSARRLPWREDDATPWGILVSEIMLQQTPVVRVLPRWTQWMAQWPTPADLAEAPTAEVLRAWDRLGYPRRALRLQECARAIVREHAGQVPGTQEELRALPGIGEYTAAAVAAFAFGRRAAVADTNIRRVLVRTIAGEQRPAPSYTARERAMTHATLPAGTERSVLWNQAVMELGALVCTARSPQCGLCPVRAHCAWDRAGRPEAPADAPRRTQRFEGTDRQMRGRIMARLRSADQVPVSLLLALDPEDPARVRRCLGTLLADGLAMRDGDVVHLPR